MFQSTEIIGRKQFEKALELYNSAMIPVVGPVDFRQAYVDMTKYTFELDNTVVHTCPPAMGYAFAAGTTDGPGAFNFIQNETHSNPLWNAVRDLIKAPSPEQVKCHYPKPILLDTGEMHEPYDWQAPIVDTQLLRIGQFVIAPVPGEFTSMSGRRLRYAINETLKAAGFPNNSQVVIAGLANTYADYIATFEEYAVQRYEGASTIYGPHTLDAYIDHYKKMAKDLASGNPTPHGTPPQDLIDKQIPFPRPVLWDSHPFGKDFGSVNVDVNPSYKTNDTVMVQFWSGNPRNNLMTNSTFLTVEQQQSDGSWKVYRTDAFWDTRYTLK
jgi:neutral ceramidase